MRVKTINDRLLNVDYADPEEIKMIISNWGMMEKLAEGGDTVASAILVDIQRAIGVSISEFGENKKAGFDTSKIEKGVLTEAQFISMVYVLGLGYSSKEIAFVLGCERQAVEMHISRGIKRVCNFLESGEKYEKNSKKRRRCGRQVVKGKRSLLYRKGKRKNEIPETSVLNPGSRITKKEKRNSN